jgi:hypothetical protein
MNPPRSRYSGTGLLLVLGFLLVPPAHAQTGRTDPYGDGYGAGEFARARYEENGFTIVRAETTAMQEFPSSGRVNAPIFAGDSVFTDTGQRAEIQLAGGSVVRIDQGSRLVFLSLSASYRETRDNTVLQLAKGSLRFEAAVDEREAFRVDTPACEVYLLGDAVVRIEERGDRTRIAVRRGVAEVATDQGAILVRGGMETEVISGERPRDSKPLNTFLADEFDRWVAGREEEFAVRGDADSAEAYRELPAEVRPYYRELSKHGSWVRDEVYGPVWVPSIVPAGWRPYRHGRWSYGALGYFWVSEEPWGWAPYHFGRWTRLPEHDWSWIPGRVFGGAWVSWSWGPTHVGWCALNYWDQPVTRADRANSVYDTQAWTFIRYEQIAQPDASAHHVGVSEVRDLDEAVVVTRAPRVAPSLLSNLEPRNRALADARSGEHAVGGAGRSFVELERQAGLELGAAAPGLGSGRGSLNGFSPRTATPGSGTSSATNPATRRPLVHSDRDKLEGASERWKDIYRQMAQPRPTRTQSTTDLDRAPRDETVEPVRENPSREGGSSRQPENH